MKPITDILRQLVRRRLWPVALLLVGALVAVPVVLAKDAEPPPAAAAPAIAASGGGVLATEPIVALAEPASPDAHRAPLGKRHDIFKPTKKAPKVKPAEDEKAAVAAKAKDDTSAEPKESDSTGGAGATPAPAPAPAPAEVPEPPKKTYPLHSLLVRFGAGGETAKGYLPKGRALPSADEPLIIYVGLTDHNKTAVFMLASTVKAQGDGECLPTPENCETVEMQEGDTEFFDIVDDQGAIVDGFQLDLVKINKGKTTGDDGSTRSTKASIASTFGRTLAAGFGRTG